MAVPFDSQVHWLIISGFAEPACDFAPIAFVLIDAEPVEKGGKKLTTHYPTR